MGCDVAFESDVINTVISSKTMNLSCRLYFTNGYGVTEMVQDAIPIGALKKSCEDIILDIAIKAIVTYWNFSLHTTFKMNIPFLVPLIFMIKSLDGRRSNHSVIRYESRTTLLSYCGNEGRPDLSREDPFYFSVRFIRLWFKHNFLQSLHRKPWHII